MVGEGQESGTGSLWSLEGEGNGRGLARSLGSQPTRRQLSAPSLEGAMSLALENVMTGEKN